MYNNSAATYKPANKTATATCYMFFFVIQNPLITVLSTQQGNVFFQNVEHTFLY